MQKKHKRLWAIFVLLAGLSAAVFFGLAAFRDSITYFYTPTQVLEKKAVLSGIFRLGGLVEKGSLKTLEDGNLPLFEFSVTDAAGNHLVVHYKGIFPDLFREGQGMIAKGALDAGGVFIASEIYAKHDEKYHPPETRP